jgi:hypothetical protein
MDISYNMAPPCWLHLGGHLARNKHPKRNSAMRLDG